MKRILNVVSLTGRLLRANRLTFNWERLAAWINMTEVWPYRRVGKCRLHFYVAYNVVLSQSEIWPDFPTLPYRTSWIVLYIEEHEDIDLKMPLKNVYQKIVHLIPQSTAQAKRYNL